MKKILLVGKLNKVIRNFNEVLAGTFSMQLCAYELEMVRGMTRIFKPDMVIISISELDTEDLEIFDYYFGAYKKIPVLVIGTKEESENYTGYFENEQFENIIRPVTQKDLVAKCCDMMHMEIDELPKAAGVSVRIKASMGKEEKTRKTIMIVDDSSLSVRSTKAMLENQYNVMIATSGIKALDFMHKRKPDLVLLDYDMPKFDGRDTLEKMKEDDELSDIPVFFLTAVADTQHITAVLKLNPDGYFLKPLEKDKVLEAIEKIIG
ncbi:MAG: response regulator [Lachnospiraceae bacterium]|nr:response regulator [Lachnospiraceae bacterium]